MVSNLLGTDRIDNELQSLILSKTEGIPFFIEEFVRSLIDLQIIKPEDGKILFKEVPQSISIPSTIQDMIMARVDALPDAAKKVLQTASAVEREFSYDLIKILADLPEKALLSNMAISKDSELLYERGISGSGKMD
jgi:predicted ATPase